MCATYRHTSSVCLMHCELAMGSDGKYTGSVHGKNLVKLLRAIDLLSRPSCASIKELQEGLGISRRSVYRLFDVLESLNFPLVEQEQPGEREKRWSLEEGYLHRMPNLRIPDVKLTPRELLVLTFLLRQDRVLVFRATIESSEMQRGIPRFCNAVFPGIARAIVRPRMGRLPLVEEPPTNKGGTIKDAHNGSTTTYSIGVLS